MPILGRPMFSLKPPELPDPALEREVEQVIDYIVETQGVRRVMLGPFVRLEADLSITGVKGDRLIADFADRFDIDMTTARGPYFREDGVQTNDLIGAALATPVVLWGAFEVGLTDWIHLAPWGIGWLCLAFLLSKTLDRIAHWRAGAPAENVQITVSDLARSLKEKRWTVKAELDGEPAQASA